jgi:hypothetical protein
MYPFDAVENLDIVEQLIDVRVGSAIGSLPQGQLEGLPAWQ